MSTEEERQERHTRLASFDRQEKARRIFIVLSVLAVLGLLAWWQGRSPIDPLDRRVIASFCVVDYKKARSAAETANVDTRAPIVGRRTAVASITCGELRRAGQLTP
jgi:hypothetical protein